MQFNEEDFFKDYLTSEQYEECVKSQTGSSQAKSLFIIAIEKGYINDKNLAAILKKIPGEKPKRQAVSKKKKRFGELCIEKGFASKKQVEECLAAQNDLKRAGKHFRLGQILIEKKYITNPQARLVLELQGKKILRCNDCETKYNIRNFKPNKK